MSWDDLEPDDLEPVDLEPVDLEPVDLEPVDLEPGESGGDGGPRREPVRWRVWALVGAVALVGWGAIAVTNRDKHTPRKATPPPSTAAPLPVSPRVDAAINVVPALRLALRGLGTGRFAAVIDDRLFVFDTRGSTPRLIPLPEGHAAIDDQSGSSLSVTTSQETLVSTAPVATRVLSAHDLAIRGVAPTRWWLLRDDRSVRNDHTARTLIEPEGLRVAAAIEQGFVAIDVQHSQWVLWSPSAGGDQITPIAPIEYRLIGAGERSVVFWHGSSLNFNQVDIVDPSRPTQVTVEVPGIPQFAQFSPDGEHLAIASTLSDIVVLDAHTGLQTGSAEGITSPIPSLPFAWTPDSRYLIVVQDHRIEVRRASGDVVQGSYIPPGLEQLVALP